MKVRRSSASQQTSSQPAAASQSNVARHVAPIPGQHHDNGTSVERWSHTSKLALAARAVAAHGGAGATTLATHLAAQLQAAVEEPQLDEAGRLLGPGERANGQRQLASWGQVPAVVVASGTAYGTKRAMARARELDGRYGVPVVVAVVADGPLPEPIAVRARLRALASEVQAVIRVPYVSRWRFEDRPSETPDRYRAAVAEIVAVLQQCSSRPAGLVSEPKETPC